MIGRMNFMQAASVIESSKSAFVWNSNPIDQLRSTNELLLHCFPVSLVDYAMKPVQNTSLIRVTLVASPEADNERCCLRGRARLL